MTIKNYINKYIECRVARIAQSKRRFAICYYEVKIELVRHVNTFASLMQ